MDRFDEMRARGVGTGGGDTPQTTGIIPLPVPYLNMQSITGERGKQNIEITFPDGATSIDLYLKEGGYPLATNDVCYQKASFNYEGEPTISKEITLKAKKDGTYPYKLYGWAVSKNSKGVQTAIGNGNRRELDVYYASNTWGSNTISTSVTSYSGTTDVTVDGNLAFINTCAGLLLLDITEGSLKLLAEGNFTEKPTVLKPRAGVYLIKSGGWYEYSIGSNTTTLLSDLGTNALVGEYGGYYFFTANINYKKSTGTIITECTNAPSKITVTPNGVFGGAELANQGGVEYRRYNIVVKKLDLLTMSYYDIGYYYENGERKHISELIYGSSYSSSGSKITDFGTGNITFLMYLIRVDDTSAINNGWRLSDNGEYFEKYNTIGISWGELMNARVLKYDICGLGANLINVSSILAKATSNGLVKIANTSDFSFGDNIMERITSLTNANGKCDLIISNNKLYEYRYDKETNTVTSTTANFYYGADSSDTTHSQTSNSVLESDAWCYLGYYNDKYWRTGRTGLYYLRDDFYWQRIIYNGNIHAGSATFNGNYIYIKNNSRVAQQIIKAQLETNGTVELIDTPTSNNLDKIELKNINGLIYVIPRIERNTTEADSNYTDFISIYNPDDGTVTKSTTLRGGTPWGENKYLSLNGTQISNIETGEVEKVPLFNSTRIITKNLYEYIEPYNGVSFNVSFSSGAINLMYAQ